MESNFKMESASQLPSRAEISGESSSATPWYTIKMGQV
jgi:hypothetical protein